MYGYVYLTTNLVNGKKYVGQHKSSYFDPEYKGSGKLIKLAFNKYGWDNFTVELLKECETREELDQCEIDEIKNRNAVLSEDYYNFSGGGSGWSASIWSNPDSCKEMSERFTGEGNPFYGKKHSEETKSKISDSKKDPSEETRKKLRDAVLNAKVPPRKGKPFKKDALMILSKKSSAFHKGRVLIYRDEVSKRVLPEELDKYLAEGWLRGIPESTRTRMSNSSKGQSQTKSQIDKRMDSLRGKQYNVVCKRCGRSFTSHSSASKICEECKHKS